MRNQTTSGEQRRTIILATIMVLCVSTAAQAKYSGGTGGLNDPYLIATAEDMNAIGADSNDWDAHFLLVADINLVDYTGTQLKIIGNSAKGFTGVFDGNDHKVWNFTWASIGMDYIGLFGYVGRGGQIKNLGMENIDVNITNGNCVGGLVGLNYGTITNCYSTGSISGDWVVGGLVGGNLGTILNSYATGPVWGNEIVGGLVGTNYNGTISDCYATGTVVGKEHIGGLAGDNYYGTITNCYSTGDVNGTGGIFSINTFYIGGLVGWNYDGTITNCYSTGSVSGDEDVGGLVGMLCKESWSYGKISSCYSTSSVTGEHYVGGLVGRNGGEYNHHVYYGGTISDCYSTGMVSGHHDVGGLVGLNDYYGTITNCYSTGRVTGSPHVGGLVGDNLNGVVTASFWDIETSGQSTSAGGTGLPTVQMKKKSTFTDAGWDFVGETINGPNDYWRMCVDDVNYPLLSWQFVPDFVCPDGVDILDLAFFVERWLAECDQMNNFCNCTDINHDGSVNFYDFAILANHWLIDYSLTPPPAMPYRP